MSEDVATYWAAIAGTMPQDATAFWAALAALASIGAVVVAAFSTYFAWLTLRTQGDPKVIVYVKHEPMRQSFLVIVIENIGRDIAEDVVFKSSRPIPAEAFGIETPEGQPKVMTETPLVLGIPALGPGDPRVINWGQYGGLLAALGGEPIVLTYTYRSGRRKFEGKTSLDVRSFCGIDATEHPVATLAKEAEKLTAEAKRISGSLATMERSQRKERDREVKRLKRYRFKRS